MQPLTPYEKRLLRLRLSGLDNQQIAKHLGKSHGTVRNTFSVINKKISRKRHDLSLFESALQPLPNQPLAS